jgi:hypothetical protein
MPSLLIDNSTTPALTCALLQEGAPTTNYIAGSAREVACFGAGDRKQWLFDFGAAPSLGGTVDFSAAALTLYCQDTNAATNGFSIYLVTSPTANTAQATWNNRSTSVAWGTAGALGSGDVNLTPLATVSNWLIGTSRSFTGALLESAIEDWCNGVTSGLQILMCRDPATAYDFTFNEFRSTGWGAPDWPTLTGTYTVGSSGPTISDVSDASANEGSSVVHTVTLSAATTGTENYATTLAGSGSFPAVNGVNFSTSLSACTFSNGVTFSTPNLVVPSGVSSFTVTVPTTDDGVFNKDRTYDLICGGTTGVGTIINTDTAPSWSVDSPSIGTRGDDVVYTITLSAICGCDMRFRGNTRDGTAVEVTDYDDEVNVTVTVLEGELTTTFTVATVA